MQLDHCQEVLFLSSVNMNVVPSKGLATSENREPLHFFKIISCVPILEKYVIFTYRISVTRPLSRCVILKCCENDDFVGLRSSYTPKQGIPWHFFIISSDHLCILF